MRAPLIVGLLGLLALVGVACSQPQATPTPVPELALAPTLTPSPTLTPQPSPTPTPVEPEAEKAVIQTGIHTYMADNAKNTVPAPNTATNVFDASGVLDLVGYLRNTNTVFFYCWDITGRVTVQETGPVPCPHVAVPNVTPAPVPTVVPAARPTPSPTPTPTPAPVPTVVPTARPTPSPTPTPAPIPTMTHTPTAKATPPCEATPTPSPEPAGTSTPPPVTPAATPVESSSVPRPFTLTVSANPYCGGIVARSSWTHIREDGQVIRISATPPAVRTMPEPFITNWADGEEVNLVALPNDAEGFSFAGWAGDCQGIERSCTLIIHSNKEVVGNFTTER